MYFSDRNNKAISPKQQNHVCPKCGFDNHTAAVYCEICFYPLKVTHYLPSSSSKTNSDPANSTVESQDNWRHELRKPSVISGLAVLALAIALWLNFFFNRQTVAVDGSKEISLYKSMSQVRDVPSGLFSYGGALYFASLVAHGINDAIMQDYPNFNLRYTKPIDQDQSYSNGIRMLLDGELSFAFNGRPLTDAEYAQAELRDVKLLQVPIAIDGIAFFGNHDLTLNNLSLDLVKDIFAGKITNWQQLGGADLPITPVLLSPEDLAVLSLEERSQPPETTQYVSNYTLAIRRVIATPGAIAFASASLIQDQQGIKIFNLAPRDSINYTTPIMAGKPNLEAFKAGVYPLTRRLFVVIRQDGTPDRLAGKAYIQMLLSDQGQKIVQESGFVPLYSE
ncbi:MAG: substrate-binding domain-containing protein [Cyanobacteria bacterium J06635_13]